MLHANESWPLTKPNLQRLQRNDRPMIRQICNVKLQDNVTIRSNELHVLAQLGIEDLNLILKERRLRWYGHMEHSKGAVKSTCDLQVDGKHGPGRPKMTWKQQTKRDRREWKLPAINLHDRHTWRSGARSAMRAASQLPGRGPTEPPRPAQCDADKYWYKEYNDSLLDRRSFKSFIIMHLMYMLLAFIHIIAANAINGLQAPIPVFMFTAAPVLLRTRLIS